MNGLNCKTNPYLFGHEAAEAQLIGDFERGQLAHGWIISGPRGIGKATLAYRFARMLLSGKPASALSEEDPVFLRIAAGSHADILVVEPLYDAKKDEFAREINVEQTREIAEFLSKTPGEGQWRVVIVDAIDALNTNSANAILKILEEPPTQAILLLISHNPGRLLPTIRSRCRNLSLNIPNKNDYLQVLALVHPEIDMPSAEQLGELTNYSPGITIDWYAQGAIPLYNQILELVSALPDIDHLKLHAFADKITTGQTHTQWQLFTRLLLCLLQRIVVCSSGMNISCISDKEEQCLAKMKDLFPADVWAAKWQAVCDQFSLAERLHLDYKQFIIVFFHSLPSKEEFRIGSAAA